MYKVCWCGGDGGCTLDEHFSMHVATLIINGMMLTVAGNGQVPNRTSDMVDPLTAPSYPPSFSKQTFSSTKLQRTSRVCVDHKYDFIWPGMIEDDEPAISQALSAPYGAFACYYLLACVQL